jgi:predicted RNase H-like HicB family nuclease
MFVFHCPELDIPSCGETLDQAKRNLMEAIQINLEEARKMGTLDRLLDNEDMKTTQ